MSSKICFVCGARGTNCVLQTKASKEGAYFQFLQSHLCPKGAELPDANGAVDACYVCYAFLMQQWQSYEQTKTSPLKRLYWLKRIDNGPYIGANMAQQGEYAAALLGIQLNCRVNGNVIQDLEQDSNISEHAMTVSDHFELPTTLPSNNKSRSELYVGQKVESTSGTKINRKQMPRTDVLNVPQPLHGSASLTTSSSFVCFLCGSKYPLKMRHFLNSQKSTNRKYKLSYFSFLQNMQPVSGANELDESGNAETCDDCYKTLLEQWQVLESSGVPDELRRYVIGNKVYGNTTGVGRRSGSRESKGALISESNTKSRFDVDRVHRDSVCNADERSAQHKSVTTKVEGGMKQLADKEKNKLKDSAAAASDQARDMLASENSSSIQSQQVYNDMLRNYALALNAGSPDWQSLPYASMLSFYSQMPFLGVSGFGSLLPGADSSTLLSIKDAKPSTDNSSSRACSSVGQASEGSWMSPGNVPATGIGDHNVRCAVCNALCDRQSVDISTEEALNCQLTEEQQQLLSKKKSCKVCSSCYLAIKCDNLTTTKGSKPSKREGGGIPSQYVCMKCWRWYSCDYVKLVPLNNCPHVDQWLDSELYNDMVNTVDGVLVCDGCNEDSDLKPLELLASLATRVSTNKTKVSAAISDEGLPTRDKTPSAVSGGPPAVPLSPTSAGLQPGNSASSSRSSGFAAALRKLAQQAESPPEGATVSTADSQAQNHVSPLTSASHDKALSSHGPAIFPGFSPASYTDRTTGAERAASSSLFASPPEGAGSGSKSSADKERSSSWNDDDMTSSVTHNKDSVSSRSTPFTAATSVSAGSSSLASSAGLSSAAAADLLGRGFQPYRLLEEQMRQAYSQQYASAAAFDPAMYTAAYHAAALAQAQQYSHPAFRMDDSSLLMERYRSLMQPSSAAAAAYYPYHAAAAAGLLPPGSSVNPFLQAAAAAGASRYPADMMSAAFPFYSGLMSAGGKGSESLLSLPGSSSHSDRPRSEDNGGRQERSNEHDRGDKTKDPSVAGREKRDDDRRSDRGQSDHSRNADHSDRRHDSQRPLDKKVTKDARSHHDRDAQSNQSSNKQNNDNRSSDYSYGGASKSSTVNSGHSNMYDRQSSVPNTSSQVEPLNLQKKKDRKPNNTSSSSSGSKQLSDSGSSHTHKSNSGYHDGQQRGGGHSTHDTSKTSHGDQRHARPNASPHIDVAGKKSHSSAVPTSSVLTIPKLLDPSLQQLTAMGLSPHYVSSATMPSLSNGYDSTGVKSLDSGRGLKRDHGGNDKHLSSGFTPTAAMSKNMSEGKGNSRSVDQTDSYGRQSGGSRKDGRTSEQQLACDLIIPTPVVSRSKLDLCEPKWLLTDAEDDSVDELSPGERRRHQLALVVNGSPAKTVMVSPAKAAFMSDLQLVTISQVEELEYERERKRRRLQREPSVSPIVVEPNSTKTGDNQIEQTSVNANSYPPSPATDIKAKCRFLGELGLELVTAECRRQLESVRKVCEWEKKRRLGQLTGGCPPDIAAILNLHPVISDTAKPAGNGSPAKSKKQRGDGQSKTSGGNNISHQSVLPSTDVLSFGAPNSSDALLMSGVHTSSLHYLSRPGVPGSSPPFGNGSVQPAGQHVDMNGVRSLDDSPLSVFSRGGDLLPILRQPKDGSLPGLPSTSGTPGTPGGAGSSTYKWQGIEAVLESYQRYREEMRMEKQILRERCQQLQQDCIDQNRTAESLSYRMSELLMTKQRLEDERLHQEAAIDKLKCCLKLFW